MLWPLLASWLHLIESPHGFRQVIKLYIPVPVLFTAVLSLNTKPSRPASASVGAWGERCGVRTIDLLRSVSTHQDWGFWLYPVLFFPTPEKRGFYNCSWHIYLNTVNLSCNKRFPQAQGSWHHSVPRAEGEFEDPHFLLDKDREGWQEPSDPGSKEKRPCRPLGLG